MYEKIHIHYLYSTELIIDILGKWEFHFPFLIQNYQQKLWHNSLNNEIIV